MHILSNVTWYHSACPMYSNPFTLTPDNQSRLRCMKHQQSWRWVTENPFIHICSFWLYFSLSFWLGSFLQSVNIWLPAERGGEKLILLLASYAVLGLSQSAPALALIRGDSLSNSSAQDLSVKRAAVGMLVNSEMPRSIRLTIARSQMTNYKETLLHFFL